ncbi:hypothetical protein Slin15195_G050930 [Septoria linicola]|uniref:Uncharacterized protein n=1 Tax=Septoria linicola TaxID=215465 RepID=A0A9Q9AP18_9PEZI|nr:hypothetical protein Slin15195_G050930 [Septoria linicola]
MSQPEDDTHPTQDSTINDNLTVETHLSSNPTANAATSDEVKTTTQPLELELSTLHAQVQDLPALRSQINDLQINMLDITVLMERIFERLDFDHRHLPHHCQQQSLRSSGCSSSETLCGYDTERMRCVGACWENLREKAGEKNDGGDEEGKAKEDSGKKVSGGTLARIVRRLRE